MALRIGMTNMKKNNQGFNNDFNLNSMIDFSVMGEAILKRILFVEQIKPLIVYKELDSYMDDKIKNGLWRWTFL